MHSPDKNKNSKRNPGAECSLTECSEFVKWYERDISLLSLLINFLQSKYWQNNEQFLLPSLGFEGAL